MKQTLFNRCIAVMDSNYQPANRLFTSTEEIEEITKLMGLNELDAWDIQNLRDMWVMLENSNRQQYQSVIAVLDYVKYNNNKI